MHSKKWKNSEWISSQHAGEILQATVTATVIQNFLYLSQGEEEEHGNFIEPQTLRITTDPNDHLVIPSQALPHSMDKSSPWINNPVKWSQRIAPTILLTRTLLPFLDTFLFINHYKIFYLYLATIYLPQRSSFSSLGPQKVILILLPNNSPSQYFKGCHIFHPVKYG